MQPLSPPVELQLYEYFALLYDGVGMQPFSPSCCSRCLSRRAFRKKENRKLRKRTLPSKKVGTLGIMESGNMDCLSWLRCSLLHGSYSLVQSNRNSPSGQHSNNVSCRHTNRCKRAESQVMAVLPTLLRIHSLFRLEVDFAVRAACTNALEKSICLVARFL